MYLERKTVVWPVSPFGTLGPGQRFPPWTWRQASLLPSSSATFLPLGFEEVFPCSPCAPFPHLRTTEPGIHPIAGFASGSVSWQQQPSWRTPSQDNNRPLPQSLVKLINPF